MGNEQASYVWACLRRIGAENKKEYLESRWTLRLLQLSLYLDSTKNNNNEDDDERNEIKILLNTANNFQRENVHKMCLCSFSRRYDELA